MLPPELSELVGADEDAQARIRVATAAARARLEEAQAAHERRRRERIEDAERRLSGELLAIQSEADQLTQERRQRRAAFQHARERAAEEVLARAAETYARIVREGPGHPARASP